MDENTDFALALQLQQELNEEEIDPEEERQILVLESNKNLSIVDPSWELTDPNPDIRALFLQFNTRFFWGRLSGIEVKWSPRMTLCAGLCVYEGRGGLCSVRLSLPLLKLRPRKDLVETLLHEMIHAYLFITDNNKDHDGHGPEFHKHMHRINKESGTGISVYHNFHDEVDEYRQHWWRCNGACQKRPPYFGYVRRAMNRAPSSRDIWWKDHERICQGTFIKIKEPENYGKKKGVKKEEEDQDSKPGKGISAKNGDIRTFIGNSNILGGNKVATASTSGGLKGNNSSIYVKPAANLTKPVTSPKSLSGSNKMPEVSRSGQHSVDKGQENATHIISFPERKFKFEDDYLTSDSDDELLFNFVESVEHNLEENKRNQEGEKKLQKTDNSKAFGRGDFRYSGTFKRVDNISALKSNEQKSGDSDNFNSHSILPGKDQLLKHNLSDGHDNNDDVKATLRRVWGEKNFNISNSDKSKVKNLEKLRNLGHLQDNPKKRTATPFEGVIGPVKKKLKISTSDSHKNKEDSSSDEEMGKIFEKIREKQEKRKQRMKTNIESQAETSDELDSNSFKKKELKFRTVSNKEQTAQSVTNLGDVKDTSILVSHLDNSESPQFKSSSLIQTSLSGIYSDSLRHVSQPNASINSVRQESLSVSDSDRLTACPVCNMSVLMNQINEHLDSCLT